MGFRQILKEVIYLYTIYMHNDFPLYDMRPEWSKHVYCLVFIANNVENYNINLKTNIIWLLGMPQLLN